MKKNPVGNFDIYHLRHTIENRTYRKNAKKTTLKLHKMAYPALKDPPGVYLMFPNQVATRTYQTPFTE